MAKKSQIQKFREAAREAGADESEERFQRDTEGLGKTKREREALDGKSLDDLAEELGQNDPAAPKRRQ